MQEFEERLARNYGRPDGFRKHCLRHGRRGGVREAELEDFAQDAQVKAMSIHPKFQLDYEYCAALNTMLGWLVKDHHRRAGALRNRTSPMPDDVADDPRIWEDRILLIAVRDCIDRLPAAQRDSFERGTFGGEWGGDQDRANKYQAIRNLKRCLGEKNHHV